MRHLVVARERRVDGGSSAHHVGEHARHDQVAHEDAQRAPHQRVDAAAMAARVHVAPDRARGGRPLEDDLPDEQDERARHVVAVGQERPVARIGLLLGVHPADREDHVVRLAGEQVPAARAAVDEQADAGRAAALDLRAVRRRRARHHRRGFLLDPAERRDVLVRSQQDPGLARARLRRQVGLPLGQAVRVVGQPAGHVGGVAIAHRAAQHRQRQAVDLEVDDPGDLRARDDALPTRDPLRDPDRVRVVGAEDDREHDAHRGDHERGQQRPSEVVDGQHPVGQLGGESEDHRVRDQHEQEAEHERQRQPQRGQHGRDDRVQRRGHRRHQQRPTEALDADTGQDPRGHHQRDARRQPRHDEREQPPAWTLGLPRLGLAVLRPGFAGHHVLLLLDRVACRRSSDRRTPAASSDRDEHGGVRGASRGRAGRRRSAPGGR